MYRIHLSLMLTCLYFFNLTAQCVVDAGEDQNICPGEFQEKSKLQGKVINGDVVQTKWESEFIFGPPGGNQFYLYASDMLNDTTILEPAIKQTFGRLGQFYLTGITSNGATCRDTVVINYSIWLTSLPRPTYINKAPKDTVSLWTNPQAVWTPVQYTWSPDYKISDTTSSNPLVWNDTTVFYHVQMTDALGCSMNESPFEVAIVPTSTNRIQFSELQVYPNPARTQLNIETVDLIDFVEIYNTSGHIIGKETGQNQLDLSPYPAGYLLLKIHFKNGGISIKKVMKAGK